MKKIIYFFAGALAMLSTTALAATVVFTDQNSFVDSWFEDAAVNMNKKGIITGYPDGSFGPSNQVSRAELAVMLNRFDEYTAREIEKHFNDKIDEIVDNTLKFAKQDYDWYTNFIVLAESGLRKLDGAPQYYNTDGWEEESGVNLPEGYKLYTAFVMGESGNPSYLHFQGEICGGDECGEELDQWYGPFHTN